MAASGNMPQSDMEICRQVAKALMSDKYKDKNYLFLHPFDLSQTPGYLDVVTKVMDLNTLYSNLESGVYTTREQFFVDCNVVFENAIAYHSNKESKWIAKLGKDMLKVAQRERKTAEKRDSPTAAAPTGSSNTDSTSATSAAATMKHKIPGMLLPTKKNKKAIADKKDGAATATKLKLKMGNNLSSQKPILNTSSPQSNSASKPKVSIKLKGPSQGKQPPQSHPQATADSQQPPPDTHSQMTSQQALAQTAESKKPRLTLKIGKSKPVEGTADVNTKALSPKTAKPSIKVSGSGGSRGKELPKGVTPPRAEPKKSSKKASTKGTHTKATATSKTAATKSAAGTTKAKPTTSKTSKAKSKPAVKPQTSSTSPSTGIVVMTPSRIAQCAKVLNGLRRRQHKTVGWFLHPVADKAIIQDYKAKIPNPMDLSTMQSKLLDKNEYTTVADFVLDLRRIVANCLRYNTSIKNSLRPVALDFLQRIEKLLTVFVSKPEAPNQVYPPLLYCWKLCLNLLDTLYNLTNPDDGQMTAYYFLYPVSLYCGGQFPQDYLQKIEKPMDYGTVTANLVEGKYSTVSEFETDCKLVLENCITYYGGQPDGRVFTEQAMRLKVVLEQQLEALNRYLKSPSGLSAQRQAQTAIATVHLPKPSIPLLLNIIDDLRSLKYTDKMTKISEPALEHFEKPVSLAAFPDYTQHVQSPMDIQTIERKVRAGAYGTPEDFEYDMLLMFQNCITYNSARKTDHLVAMGRYAMKMFRKVFSAKMRAFEDPSSASTLVTNEPPSPLKAVTETRKEPPTDAAQQGAAKKAKVDIGDTVRAKVAAPRITLSTSSIPGPAKPPKALTPKAVVPKSKPNQPVPLHIAIAQVKEQFPLRRAVKALQPWESACARFFKEMMRHSWISAARPKFIFHVPVPVLFPELREAYAAKIKKPMDLTTVECALLAGNRYASPESFVSDLALVFSNAIIFNKDGRDVGDPLSCAYYDASIHLLHYCRWLSLELLSDYIEETEHVDEPDMEGLPLTSWKLTSGNRKRAREEMEAIVLKEPIERSLEGDRYTWTEGECEKLLKALRHQSDLRYMTFFIQPNYPADYTAFIARPMDWERVQKGLKKRQYIKFGDIIEDLRLIFSNALKYNARHKGTDTVSGRAYDAAVYMSAKLEAAVNKMMLTVSDRVERERIDHNNAEREIEAAERAEEERIRAQWNNEGVSKDGAQLSSARVESSQRIRPTKRSTLRKEQADFEIPFFDDEDDGQHERSYFEVVRQQKALFERQRQERSRMQQSAATIGSSVLLMISQHELALRWLAEERKKLNLLSPPMAVNSHANCNEAVTTSLEQTTVLPVEASKVLQHLEDEKREPIKINLSSKFGQSRKKRVKQVLKFE